MTPDWTAGNYAIFIVSLAVSVVVMPTLFGILIGICARKLPGSPKALARVAVVLGIMFAVAASYMQAAPEAPAPAAPLHGVVVIKY